MKRKYRKKGTGKTFIKCQNCGKSFETFKCYIPVRKYCSKECRNKAKSERMKGKNNPSWNSYFKRKCESCGKVFYVSPCRMKWEKLFCNMECRKKYRKSKLVKIKCVICGKEFIRVSSQYKQKLCSKECIKKYYSKYRVGKNSTHWQGGQIERICMNCGKKFYVDKCVINRRDRNITAMYCSHRCRALENIKHTKKKDTDIEILLESWLKENNIKYEKQKVIENISIADFFIQPNICLFADGNYWHSTSERIKRDGRQTTELIQKGYIVYRLKGSEIKQGVRPNEILCH